MINTITGLSGCNSSFACPWCKASKDDRHKVDGIFGKFDPAEKTRTIEENVSLALLPSKKGKSSPQKFGVVNAPLFKFIPLVRTVPDCLHAFLRISDGMLDQIMQMVRRKDNLAASNSFASTTSWLTQLESDIRKLGLFFEIDIRDGNLKCTNLSRPQRLIVFRKLDLAKFTVETRRWPRYFINLHRVFNSLWA